MSSSRVSRRQTLVEIARRHAAQTPDRPAYAFLGDGEQETARFGFAAIDLRARAVAAALQDRGLARERVLIAYPSGPEYVQGLLGCLYAGAVAVPCDEPRPGPGAERLTGIRGDAEPLLALAAHGRGRGVPRELEGLEVLDVARVPDSAASEWTDPHSTAADLAFLQYTSGSTRQPRGVMVSHGNLLANERSIKAACGHDRDSTFVGWVPLFHDMGLVANLLQPLYLGSLSVLMPPMSFLQRPGRWLRAVSRYRAHTSGGPNFAYELCVERMDAAERDGLDLSHWRVAYNGAEPIRATTLRRFTESFAPHGFTSGTHFPSYGLAEATLLVATGTKGEPPSTLTVDSAALRTGAVLPAGAGAPTTDLVGNGAPGLDTEVQIVDPRSQRPCPDGRIGEVWVRGPGTARGYWGRPAESRRALGARLSGTKAGPFLRTGDLGALFEGELFLVGRHQDLVVVRGQNHFPHDLEWTAEQAHSAVRPGCVAAFTVPGEGGERLVLCCELTTYGQGTDPAQVAEQVRAAMVRRHGVAPHALVVLRRGGIAKTTSGKVRRRHCQQAYVGGRLPVHKEFGFPQGEEPELVRTSDPQTLATALRDAAVTRAARAGSLPDLTERVGDLGLDSLAAVRLQHRIQSTYRVRLPATALLGDLTYRQLAELTLSAPKEAETASAPGSGPGALADGWLPLTDAQRALWFEQALAPDASAYHLVRALVVRGPYHETRLAGALNQLVQRHPALRTRFALRDGQPVCRADAHGPGVRVLDATAMSDTELREWLVEEGERPFALAEDGPPVRLTLLRRRQDTVLLLAAHHLVADFWSLVVLLRELAHACAEALPTGEPAGQAQFLDAERRAAKSGVRERGWAHWSEALEGVPLALDLPTDLPRPATRGFVGATRTFTLGADLSARLAGLAQEQGATLFTTLLAAYQLLLHRFSGQPDLVVGTLLARRDTAELADAVGYLVNSLPIRSTRVPGESFTALLRRTRATVLGAVEHGAYPFGPLVSRLAPDRTSQRTPLAQCRFVLQREHDGQDGEADGFRALALGVAGKLSVGGLELEALPLPRRWAQLDLSLSMAEIDGRLTGVWEYRTDLFTEGTVDELSAGLVSVLRSVTDAPEAPVEDVLLTRPGTPEPAGGPVVPRAEVSLHELVAEAAWRAPERVALSCPTADGAAQQLSHGTLHRASTALAARLVRLGVRPEEPVAVLAERGPELPLAYLGVLHAGATVLPLNPEDPDRRLEGILEAAGARVLLTQQALSSRAARLGARVLTVEEGITGPERTTTRTHPEQAAYLLYTSGSTGAPKGVLVPHRAIVNRVLWMQEAYRLTPGERVLHKTPVTFDVSMWELFWPLTAGGCLVTACRGGHRDPAHLARFLMRENISTTHFVPSMLVPFLAEVEAGRHRLPGLRRVLCSGERLPAGTAGRMAELLDAEVHNLYGPTEAAVDVTAWHCRAWESGPVPIGRPIANTHAQVLDDQLRPQPRSFPGELYLGGVCLARGYLGAPAQTAERFLPAHGGARWYRTGDLARRRPDGALEFRGRTDDQVKIGGIRTEPGEVAEALRALPGVADAAVVAEGGRLLGYVVPQRGSPGPPAPEALRETLRGRLPGHLVPAVITPVEQLPLTASGKLDRRALPSPAKQPGHPHSTRQPPRPGTEHQLATIWADRLGHTTIDAHENFFALGGDSIQALGVVAACRASGLPVTVTDLLRLPTVRALAAHLDRDGPPGARPGTDEDPGPPAPFALCPQAAALPGAEDAYPMSMAQRAVLFHRDHNGGYEVYVTSVAVAAVLDQAALAEAVRGVLARHPYLRSSFDLLTYPEPTQIVWATAPLPLRVLALPAPDEFEAWLRSERKRSFDPAAGLLVRFTAHDGGAGFRLTVSSFALDGWCVATVLTEIIREYGALRGGGLSPVTAPAATYREFVALERAAQHDPAHRAFWESELAGSRPSKVPRRQVPRPTAGQVWQHREVVEIPAPVRDRLVALATELGVGLKHVLLGVHLRVLRALTGEAEVITGLETNGRPERYDGDRVVGVFNNILPLRHRVDGGSWADLAQAAYAAEARISPFRRYPLAQAQRTFQAAGLFDTLFVFTHFHLYRQVAGPDGTVLSDLQAPDQTYVPLTAHFHLDALAGGRLRLLLESDPREFPDAQTEEIAASYRAALSAAAERPHDSYRAVPALSVPPRAPRVRPVPAAAGSVYTLFQEQVRRGPDRIALSGQRDHLSYRALEDRVARLAGALRAVGTGPDTVVALWAHRRADAVVALLAVLRAGGAFLPLDPAHPPYRQRQVLTESGATLLLLPPGVDTPLREGHVPVLPVEARDQPLPPVPVHPENLASVMATSGSTGTPKTVGVPHRGLLNYLRWAVRRYRLGPDTDAPVHSSLGFDLTLTALLGPLVSGGRAHLIDSDDPGALGSALATGRHTFLKATPSHLAAVSHQLGEACGLRTVVAGGEPLHAGQVRALRSFAPDAVLVNEYGPTETVIGCTAHTVDGPWEESPIPVGTPLHGVAASVVEDESEAPPGVLGELYISGAAVTRGYLGRPGATAAVYVPDPYAVSARRYRTGDLARRLPNASLLLAGRADRQVKIRGHRVELGEIEQALATHPGVHEAAAVTRPSAGGGQRLLAYWVPAMRAGQNSVEESELRAALAARLPRHAIPAELVELSALLLSPHGKVDLGGLADRLPPRQRTPDLAELLERVERLSDAEAASALRNDRFTSGGDDVPA